MRIVEVTDPKARFMRNYVRLTSIGPTIVIILVFIYLWYIGISEVIIGLTAAFFFSLEIIYVLVVARIFGRSGWPIEIYSNGVEFHCFPLDRILRVPGFVEKSDIIEVRLGVGVSWPDDMPGAAGPTSSFGIKTRGGRHYWSGQRNTRDAKMAVDSIESWGVSVSGPENQRQDQR
ncbi:MAG: hypothetical protein LUO85_01085 [Methanomassiliicoccales archaeon]|nr:hypothetical protein [Methanomassiliicoccales archaeon]